MFPSHDRLPGYVTGVDVNEAASNPLTNSLFQQAKGLLDPYFADQERSLNQDLANRGLPVGGEASNRALTRFDQSRNDAYTRAAYDSIMPSIDLGFRNAGLQNQGRQQGIAERQALRGNQYQELGAILGGAPVQTPQFSPPSPVDVVGPQSAAYQGQLSAYNNAQANRQATFGGLMGLGGSLGAAAILSSDRRIKKHIRRIGTHRSGVGIYRYRYKAGGPYRTGVMAQEVRKVRPDAVVNIGGVLHVNYGVLNHG